jgi:tetratricopeptide (TPR) repeat protein
VILYCASGRYKLHQEAETFYATFEISAQFLEESKSTNQAYANALELLGVLGHLYFTGMPQGMFTCASKYAHNIPEEPLNVDDITGLSRWHVSRLPKFLHGLSLNDELDDLPTSLHDALGVLRSFAIITIQLETKEISMHPLAHAWARDRLIEADRQDAWVCTMSLIALSTCSCVSFVGTCHHDHEEFWRPLQPHIETCIDESPQKAFDIYPSIEIGRMFAQFAWFFYRVDNFIRCKAQTTILRKKFDSEDPLLTNSSWIEYIHALCLIPLHDHHTAQGILESIVCSNEGSTAVTNRVLFATKMALAAIYLLEGKNQLAVDILREVVRTIATSSQYSTLDVLWAQHEFARALSMDGKQKDAISLLRDIVKMQKTTTEPENPSRLSSLQRLAIELSKDGSHEEAISILRDVVQIQNSTKKAGHVSLLASQHELAVALSRAGEHKEAIFLFQDIVQIHKTNMNHININCLTSQHELAVALSRAGKHKQAVSLLQEVVQIQNAIFNPTHPILISSQQALAWVLLWGGDYKEALKITQPVMIIAEREWDPSDWRRRNCEFLIQECVAKKGKDANGTAVKTRGLQVKENGGEVREGGGERMKRWGEKMWEKKRWGKKS